MIVNPPESLASVAVEAAPSPQTQTTVRRLATRADRLRVLGRKEEADAALLQAWAALDA
ncbi:MAG: hypothetical protein JOZ05_01180 [Acetobacteraceae bacterium]|nr:hypothetical protein [Acetobacteraceae bacterium]